MVRMVPDRTRRFAEPPHYTIDELDRECERLVSGFLRKKHGDIQFPISTDDLHVLIEQHDASVDAYADLSAFSDDVEDVTEFFPDKEPMGFYLGEARQRRAKGEPAADDSDPRVRPRSFSIVIFGRKSSLQNVSSSEKKTENKEICKRDTILNASQYDWMEWPGWVHQWRHSDAREPCAPPRDRVLPAARPCTELKIHKQNGRISQSYSHGNDPRRIKG